MSNYTDWERRNSLPRGCATPLAVMCFALTALSFYIAVSRWLFDYPDSSWQLVVAASAMGGFFLYAGVALTRRVATGKLIPASRRGGEPPPAIEVYHFLPEDGEDGKDER